MRERVALRVELQARVSALIEVIGIPPHPEREELHPLAAGFASRPERQTRRSAQVAPGFRQIAPIGLEDLSALDAVHEVPRTPIELAVDELRPERRSYARRRRVRATGPV